MDGVIVLGSAIIIFGLQRRASRKRPLLETWVTTLSALGLLAWGFFPPANPWWVQAWLVFAAVMGIWEIHDDWRRKRRWRKLTGGCLAGLRRIESMVRTLGERAKPRQRLIPQPGPA
jgi:hypothetical protein